MPVTRPVERSLSRSARLFGHLGSGLGFVGWVIGLGIALAAGGDGEVAMRTLPSALLMSLGLWLVSVLVIEGARSRFGDRNREVGLTIAGYLLLTVGLIAIVLHHWILPELLRAQGAREMLAKTHSAIEVPLVWRIPPLALGVALLCWPAWRMLQPAPDRARPESPIG